jgi:hypothetical protein
MRNTTALSGRKLRSFRLSFLVLAQLVAAAFAHASSVDVIVSVPEQKMYVFNADGEKLADYRISTSFNGTGDGRGTYATPLGRLEIANKIGSGAPLGAVFKAGRRTGEICKPNSKGRDPIVTRILHLRGLESQNAHAFGRCIYIHGTPDEKRLGKPVSYGCVRMSSSDVVELFDMVGVGTKVEITRERVTGMFGGIVKRPVKVQAIASANVDSAARAAVSTKPSNAALPAPIASAPRFAATGMLGTHSHATKNATPASGSGSHFKLMETSGLTINFGGGIDHSDRPR